MTSYEHSESQPPEANRFWRRLRVFVLYPLLLLSVCLGMFAGWMVGRNRAAQKLIDQHKAEIVRQGLPVDNASLATYHDSLSSTEQLDDWLQVLTMLQSERFKRSSADLYPWKPDSVPAAPDEVWPDYDAVVAFLDNWNRLLESSQRLAQADIKRRMPVTVDGLNTDLKWASSVRQMARLFQAQAAEAIYRRDSADTCDAILNILGCARSVEGQPLIVSQLIAIAIESIAIEELQRAIELDVLAESDLQRILTRIRGRTPWPQIWQVGLISERAASLPVYAEPKRYLGEEYRQLFVVMPWRARDELMQLTITAKWLALPTENLDDFRTAYRRLDEQVVQELRGTGLVSQFDSMISRLILPAYAAYGEAIVQREMRFRLAELALGVRMYQQRYAKLPDSLDELKQVGIDPSGLTPPGNKPFGFRKLEASVALWGFQSRNTLATPDDPPDISEGDHQWDRMWLWQLD